MAKVSMTAPSDDENLKSLEKGLIKQYGEGVIVPGNFILENPKKVLNVSPKFDLALGGIPEGSWATFAGPPGCGKTTLALAIAAAGQIDDRLVFYLDAEGRLKPMNLNGIKGLKATDVRVVRSTTERQLNGEDFLNIATNIIKAHRGCILIIDSASALCPSDEMSNDVTGKARSSNPKTLGNFVRKNAGIVSTGNNIVVIIKHIISNTSGFGSPHMEDGGVKVKYQADIQLRTVTAPKTWKEQESVVGQIIEWDVLKYALPLHNNIRKFETYIRYGVGVDDIQECMELAQDFGIIDVSGTWLALDYNGEKIKYQGGAKFRAHLEEHPDVIKYLKDKLHEIQGV